MSAKTRWWLCGLCGFQNKPRLNQDASKCEQCGGSSSEQDAVDYDPNQVR